MPNNQTLVALHENSFLAKFKACPFFTIFRPFMLFSPAIHASYFWRKYVRVPYFRTIQGPIRRSEKVSICFNIKHIIIASLHFILKLLIHGKHCSEFMSTLDVCQFPSHATICLSHHVNHSLSPSTSLTLHSDSPVQMDLQNLVP